MTLQIQQLAARFKVRIQEGGDRQSAKRFTSQERTATGMHGTVTLHELPIKTDTQYAVALHELGHVVSPRQVPITSSDTVALSGAEHTGLSARGALSAAYLFNELDAWQWAREHAIEWTEEMTAEEQRCLRSYAGRWDWETIGLQSTFAGTLLLEQWHQAHGGNTFKGVKNAG